MMALGLFALSAYKADALTLSPPAVEINAKPGETVEMVAKIFNEGDSPIVIQPVTYSFTSKNETGQPDFYDDQGGLDLQHWISVPQTVSLAPQERRSVVVTIAVPKSADPGGHYASIFWGTSPPRVDQGASVEGRIAMLILVNIEGNIKEDARVLEFKALRAFVTHLPADFMVRFQNNGTVHVHPAGDIIIRNMFGQRSATVPFNIQPSTGNVLPKSIRRFDVSWVKNVLEEGASEWRQEWNNFAFGRYSAELNVAYGQSSKSITVRTAFWVFPWMVTIVGLVVIGAAFFLLRLLLAAYKRRIINQYTQGKGRK